MKHLYRTAAQILRANGYAPAAIPAGQTVPYGPWALGAMDYSEYERPNSTATAAVFTALHPRPGSFAGAIADPASTRLATIRAKASANVKAEDVAALIERHLGAHSPRLVDEHSTTWILKVAAPCNAFELNSVGGVARVEIAVPSFIALAGDWQHGSPLTVPRDELPVIDRKRAEALVADINELVLTNTPLPAGPVFAARVAPPTSIHPELRYGNRPAIDKLRENGYEVCAVPWGEQLPASDDWKRGLTGLQFDRPAPDAGVGIVTAAPSMKWSPRSFDTWIITLTLRTALRELSQFVAAQLGKCPVRESSDGTLVFMLRQDGRNTWSPVEFAASLKDGYIDVAGTRSTIRIESRNNVLVVSGLDAAKNLYRWRNGDPLSVPRAELPLMDDSRARNLVIEVRRLMERLSLERAG